MATPSERLENKVDSIDDGLRKLITAIHEQSVSIVRLCEQMKSSTEAVGRAHSRIDGINDKVEALRDLPARFDYLEKRVDTVVEGVEQTAATAASTSNKVSKSQGSAETLTRFSPWLIIGAVVTALALLGTVSKLINGGG